MKPKYSKRVREEAALICAIAASTPRFGMVLSDVATALGIDANLDCGLSKNLACEAWWHPTLHEMAWAAERAAAAEQLIRTGWTP